MAKYNQLIEESYVPSSDSDTKLLKRVLSIVENQPIPELQTYLDAYHLIEGEYKGNKTKWATEATTRLSDALYKAIPRVSDIELMRALYTLHREVLRMGARYSFDLYCQYIEFDREPTKRFYLPRRKQLLRVVRALQRLHDNELDLLCISMPPGVGKTTLALFYLTFEAGSKPDEPILMGSHSNSLLQGAYGELLRLLDPEGEYHYNDIFPPVVKTQALNLMIDIETARRFSTIEMASVGAGNAGRVRCTNLLYCDDLIASMEEAMSPERLDKKWQAYTVDLRQRKIGDHCKELHIATRWALRDVIGRLEEVYHDSPRAEFIVEAAVDENGESRFDYEYGLGYTTEQLRQQKEIMDPASWKALYMNEPIELEGQLYEVDKLRRYFELPDRDPDAIVAVCDTKTKGTDYCCMPIGYIYGQDVYIEDVLCDDGKPEVIEPRLAMKLLTNNVQMARFESNSAGGKIAEKIQEMVKEKNGITKITTKYTLTNKETQILVASPWVIEHCLFKDTSVINDGEYKLFLRQLTSYSLRGRNKHDDVVDAMAQLSRFIQTLTTGKVEVFKRPF